MYVRVFVHAHLCMCACVLVWLSLCYCGCSSSVLSLLTLLIFYCTHSIIDSSEMVDTYGARLDEVRTFIKDGWSACSTNTGGLVQRVEAMFM